jgi:two-component system, cell cycle response regulator DivK
MTRHALIIDDNFSNLTVLAQLLELEGVASTKVQDAGKLQSTLIGLPKTDVVFLDLEMPEVDGYRVHELLKADPRFQTVPIVVYTVHVSEIQAARKSGFHSFLSKPLNPDRFPDQLNKILRDEPVWTTTSF